MVIFIKLAKYLQLNKIISEVDSSLPKCVLKMQQIWAPNTKNMFFVGETSLSLIKRTDTSLSFFLALSFSKKKLYQPIQAITS